MNSLPAMPRRLIPLVLVLAALAAPASALAASDSVVVSEFRFRGPSGGNDEFIELQNVSAAPVPIAGWTIVGCSATGPSGTRATIADGVSLPAGGHYLLTNRGSNGYSGPVAGDQTYPTGISDNGGLQLVNGSTTVDAVGATQTVQTCREGAGLTLPTSNPIAQVAWARTGPDTDRNEVDFQGPRPATPENASGDTADQAPSVSSVDPPNNTNDVPTGSNVTVTFSEPVDAAPSAFSLTCEGTAVALTVSGGPTTFTLDPDTELPRASTCTVRVARAGVSDQDDVDPPDHPAADFVSRFNTPGAELRIHEIQGAGQVSPHADEVVSRVPGVITAIARNGYWIQDPQPDADERTSEGVFAFTNSKPPATLAVGDAVLVSGRVSEFRAAATGLSTTEISFPSATETGTGTIAPTIVGAGGRVPPARTIEDDAFGDVEAQQLFDPADDGIDFHESLEGMLVQIDDAVAVGPVNGFGEIPVLADGGAGAGPRTSRGGIVVTADDFNPERLILDDVIAPTPDDVDVRDSLGTVRAVVDYGFGNYKYEVVATPTRTSGGLEREVTEAPSKHELAVASFNVENLDPTDPPSKFDRLASILVNNLRAPDLVAVEEVQDDTGPADTGTTEASQTWSMLITAVVAAGGPLYEYRQIDPVDKADGGEPGGNIRQGFLYSTDRGLSFVDRPGGDATTPTAEDDTQPGAQLTLSPGRIDPANPAFTNSRKPLAGEFRYDGRPLFVVANHFNSKGGDDPLFGRRQPPVRSSEDQRHAQAAVVNAFVDSLLAADKRANVVVLGDLNDFDFSETLQILEGGALVNLVDALPLAERYSYVFDGNSQVLDQILVSDALRPSAEYDSVHVNAEFHDQDSDHDPQVARLRVTGEPADDTRPGTGPGRDGV